jgi:hypothetical protein
MLSTTSNRQARVYCTKTTRAYNEDNAEWEEGARTHRETTSIALLVSFLMIQEDSSSHSLSLSLYRLLPFACLPKLLAFGGRS